MSRFRLAASNATALFASDVFNRGTTFVLYMLVARALGSRQFGQIALALNLFHVFHIFAVLGMKALLTREIARDKETTGLYLFNGSAIVVVSTVVSIVLLYGFVHLMRYAPDTSFIIMFVSLGLVPYSLSVICEAVFQAWERMHYIAYTYAIANVGKLVFTVLLLYLGYDVTALLVVLVATRTVTLLLQWRFVLKKITVPTWSLNPRFCVDTLRKSMTFLGLQGVHVFRGSVNTILLSKFGGEVAVGLFSAAEQLRLPVTVAFESITTSVYPAMCRRFTGHAESLRRIVENLVALLLAIALPAAVGLFLLSGLALQVVYGNREFVMASTALQILSWTVISNAMTSALGQVFLASSQERTNLRIVIVNAVLSVVLGFILVSRFGIVGAATAGLIVSAVNLIQHYVPVAGMLPGAVLSRLTWPSLIATALMATYVIGVAGQNLFVIVFSAAAFYGLLLTGLTVVAAGGLDQFKERYRFLVSS